ncbi:MAG: radical SAM family heme chaperone HemW [Candidatus Saccharicenans sp.]|nr:radical SAM family heme chaperone HemW [Candidatus Saccharicenans sp.]
MSEAGGKIESGLYLHYPFCVSKCPYCHFSSVLYESELHRMWLQRIEQEINLLARFLACYLRIDTVYFGGGTPSLLGPEEVQLLISRIKQKLEVEAEEITLEVNPQADPEWIPGWLESGITRLSFGVQSFDPSVLRKIGRSYSPAEVINLLEKSKQSGAKNIGVDLMTGIPGESLSSIEINFQVLDQIRPEHVSVYLLEELENVPFRRIWEENPVSEEQTAERYECYRSGLEEKGWRQYEISNFASPGFECRHNLKYWKYRPFVGLGPASSSHLANLRWTVTSDIREWLETGGKEEVVLDEFLELTPEDEVRENLASSLRLTEGVSLEELASRYPFFCFSAYERKIKKLLEEGFLLKKGDRIMIPPENFLVSNWIISELIFP